MPTRAELDTQLAAATTDENRADIQRQIDELPADVDEDPPEEPPPPGDVPPGGLPDPRPPAGGARATLRNVGMNQGPSMAQLMMVNYVPLSNGVATPDIISKIGSDWRVLGAPSASLGPIAWDLARHCADVGSSDAATLVGNSPYAPAIARQTLAGAVKTHCTLRQFCMYYAKVVWNIMLHTNTPPASWQKWEFRSAERFAAFDFFQGVTNEAALKPVGGLTRQPTDEELNASATGAYVNVVRATQGKNNRSTYAAEVTHARIGADARPRILEAP